MHVDARGYSMTPYQERRMKAFAASVLLSGAMLCEHALADDGAAAPVTPPVTPEAHATHGKLMKECLDKQRSQSGTATSQDSRTARKLCAVRVRTQMQQLKDAGAPPAKPQ
jgi:hypothetical protein